MKEYLMNLWESFRGNLKEKAKERIKGEIGRLDRWEPALADLIRKNVDADKAAKSIVDFVQAELDKALEKAF